MMKESPCVLAGHDCTTDCNRAECERRHVCNHVGVTDGGKSLLNFASISARTMKRDGHPCQGEKRSGIRVAEHIVAAFPNASLDATPLPRSREISPHDNVADNGDTTYKLN